MLRRFADGDFNGWRGGRWTRALLLLFNSSLDGVPQQLANDVFEMAEDVGKCGFEMPHDFNFREHCGGSIGSGCEGSDFFAAAGYNFFGIAFEEDVSYKLGLGGFRIGDVFRRLEDFVQCDVLLTDYPPGDSLHVT